MKNQEQIKTIEEKIQDALREAIILQSNNTEQGDTKQDLIDALAELQKTELLALRRAYE